jgi:outer membrane protein TolC
MMRVRINHGIGCLIGIALATTAAGQAVPSRTERPSSATSEPPAVRPGAAVKPGAVAGPRSTRALRVAQARKRLAELESWPVGRLAPPIVAATRSGPRSDTAVRTVAQAGVSQPEVFPNPGSGVGRQPQAPPPALPIPGGTPPVGEANRLLTPEDLIKPNADAGSSPRRLAPGVGDVYIPPPPVPPVPPGFGSLESNDAQVAARPRLELGQLEQSALENNPTLIQARAQVEGALGNAIQAGLWPNPSLIYKGLLIGDPLANHQPFTVTAGIFEGGGVNQTIITAGKRRLDRAKMLEMTKASQWKAVAQEWEILNRLRMGFWVLLALQAEAQIQKELVQNAEDFVVTIREGYNLGTANRADLHHENAHLQRSRVQLLSLENLRRRAWATTTALAGLTIEFALVEGSLEGDTAPIEYDKAMQHILDGSPELMAASFDAQAAQINLRRQRVEPWPNLFVQGGVGVNTTNGNHPNGMVDVGLSVPLWNQNQGNVRAANANLTRQMAEIQRIRLDLQSRMGIAYQEYLTSLQMVENLQKVGLPELRRAYAVMLDAYEENRATWNQVLEAQRHYFEARAEYTKALGQWRAEEVKVVGFLLPADPGSAMAEPAMGPGAPDVIPNYQYNGQPE